MIEEVYQKQKKKEARQLIDLAKEMAVFSSNKRIFNQNDDLSLQKIDEQKEEAKPSDQILRATTRLKKKDSSSPPIRTIKYNDSGIKNEQENILIRIRSTVSPLDRPKKDNEAHVSFKNQLSRKKLFETISPSDDQSDRREQSKRKRSIDNNTDTERNFNSKGNNNYISTITNTIPSTIVSTISNENNPNPNGISNRNATNFKSILSNSKRHKLKTVNNSMDTYTNYKISDDIYNDNFALENNDEEEDDFNELNDFDSTYDQQSEEGNQSMKTLRKKTLYEREMYNLKVKNERLNKQRQLKVQTIEKELHQYPQINNTSRMITEASKYIPIHIRQNHIQSIKHIQMLLNETKRKQAKERQEQEELKTIKKEREKKTKGNTKVNWTSFVNNQIKWKNEVTYKNIMKGIIEENKIIKDNFHPKISMNTKKIAEQLTKKGVRPEKDIHSKLYNESEERNDRKEQLVIKNKPSFHPKISYKSNYIRNQYIKSKRENNNGQNEEMYWNYLFEEYDKLNNYHQSQGNANVTKETLGSKQNKNHFEPSLTERIDRDAVSKSILITKENENESFSLSQYRKATEYFEQIENNKTKKNKKGYISTTSNTDPYSNKGIDEYCQTEAYHQELIPIMIGLPEMFNQQNKQQLKPNNKEENDNQTQTENEIEEKSEEDIKCVKSKADISNTFRNELKELQKIEMQTEVQDTTYRINICKNASLKSNPDIIIPSSRQYQFLLSKMA